MGTLVFCELIFFTFLSIQEGRFVSARELFDSFYYFDSMGNEKCPWGAQIAPHPHLGFYYHSAEPCRHPLRNNFGLAGKDIGFEKDPQYFNILILGASVAEAMGSTLEGNQLLFEKILNENWLAPNGKSFHVISAAIAAAQGIMPPIQTLLFSHLADMAISIEGYNEHFALKGDVMIESMPTLWEDLERQREKPITSALLAMVTRWVREAHWSRYSYTHFLFVSKLSGYLDYRWREGTEFNSPYPRIPEIWSSEKKQNYYLTRYGDYLRAYHAIFKAKHIPAVTFIQPAPRFFKTLTATEEINVGKKFDSRGYEVVFKYIENLNPADVPHESLLKIYENRPETLYIDHIHTNKLGLEIMAREIAERLAKREGWKRKPPKP
jgi:lysophospholipase L1-like esterase